MPFRPLLLPLVSLLMPMACGPPPVQWQSVSGHGFPTAAEASDCRMQARRLAEHRYPRQRIDSPRPPGPGISTADLDRFPAETAFYDECLRQKGYRLVETR